MLVLEPRKTWLSGILAKKSANQTNREKVGKNAVMQAWKAQQVEDFPYPLDLGYERFWDGNGYRFSGLLYFGKQEVTADLPDGSMNTMPARSLKQATKKPVRCLKSTISRFALGLLCAFKRILLSLLPTSSVLLLRGWLNNNAHRYLMAGKIPPSPTSKSR